MIRFYCSCGKRLKVDDALAGRSVQCTQCGATMQAPGAEPETVSGPEALVSALRDLNGPAPDDIPEAEVIDGPPVAAKPISRRGRAPSPEKAQALEGLDALARAAGPAPVAKVAARRPQAAVRGRKGAASPARPALPGGRRPPAAGAHRNAAVIGAVAAVALIIVFAIVAAFVGGGSCSAPAKPEPPPPPAQSVVEVEKPKRFTGHQPGEMFNNVPFADEQEAAGAAKDPPKK